MHVVLARVRVRVLAYVRCGRAGGVAITALLPAQTENPNQIDGKSECYAHENPNPAIGKIRIQGRLVACRAATRRPARHTRPAACAYPVVFCERARFAVVQGALYATQPLASCDYKPNQQAKQQTKRRATQ